MKITIIGTGYVGLVTGACLAEFGHHITCMDKDERKINSLLEGKIPIYEPGLAELVRKNVSEGRLAFTTELADSVQKASAVFLAVGTPTSRRGDGYADLTYIYAAARELAPYLSGYTVIIDKSTVPVGTARQVARLIREENPTADFDVVSNPEFLREGAAINDFMRPDRIVIGSESVAAQAVMKEIYDPLYLISTPFVFTGLESAELIKYAANAFLSIKISFINEMANLCEEVGADVVDLAKAIGLDGRIGGKFLHPGPGFGGSCFPKDTLALLRIAQENGVSARSVAAAVEINAAQKAGMVKKIREALGGDVAGKTIGVLGLTFKPETDDLRDAPALSILPPLHEKGAIIQAHDPQGMEEAKKIFPECTYVNNVYEAATGADALVLMTEWNQYRAIDLERVKSLMRVPLFIDLRNVYSPQRIRAAGFEYVGVGRG
ncbi:MAG: UDP-glucose/GDP-mannose dehydrogenase family protein [Proteobacteria bacterium]|jgi:UDPglucose 6-dehydrogenase|nr:UDP-glucose/GDP-mannose dehydrogenase family protein [Desulfocapsa sp.]MBU3945321.1 UDP-glucose/GDP-mannose dehydrogenase family protein [Pseudomonadota bacterium]MCG2744717.1 UDP-glucose/GDP-mannose dehydrogenase family protein [Desulfobacteraceae bacterium]MBU4084476.1 UDP-glucose/GDP-mannose dehydrogenase family protein [Pseudomonadota bacterium]MBU4107761.1 UDP-glucose/GDP-mannose dehydrogenase family protein [Pseudomonadota bacterium]